jgi:hypothetical protein
MPDPTSASIVLIKTWPLLSRFSWTLFSVNSIVFSAERTIGFHFMGKSNIMWQKASLYYIWRCNWRNVPSTLARLRDPLDIVKSHRNPFETGVRKYYGVFLSIWLYNSPVALFKFPKPLQASTRPLSEKWKSHRILIETRVGKICVPAD